MENKPEIKRQLIRKVIFLLAAGFVVLAIIFFLPAGTWDYWQAWVYLALLFIPVTLGSFYFIEKEPALIERRLRLTERKKVHKKITNLAYPLMIFTFFLPGFDRRYGWSNVPIGVAIAANLLVFISYIIIFVVFRENSYASRTIHIEQGQKVISSGPYALVRHPMYVGSILRNTFTPLALGSWVATIPGLLLIPIMIARLLHEERMLAEELEGYKDYMVKTKYRLIPGIW
jgi:protein-S-isoprenylcysteine O-methyltransferase Ste14